MPGFLLQLSQPESAAGYQGAHAALFSQAESRAISGDARLYVRNGRRGMDGSERSQREGLGAVLVVLAAEVEGTAGRLPG